MPTNDPGLTSPSFQDDRPPSVLMFWLLTLLATSVFVPCVLVPVWSNYKAMVLAERLEAREILNLQSEIEHLDRHLLALQNDPAVIARVAQRDLGYSRSGLSVVSLASVVVPETAPVTEAILPVEPPPAVAALLEWVPFTRRAQLFNDPTTRAILICLSGGLLAAAFTLFPPVRRAERGRRRTPAEDCS